MWEPAAAAGNAGARRAGGGGGGGELPGAHLRVLAPRGPPPLRGPPAQGVRLQPAAGHRGVPACSRRPSSSPQAEEWLTTYHHRQLITASSGVAHHLPPQQLRSVPARIHNSLGKDAGLAWRRMSHPQAIGVLRYSLGRDPWHVSHAHLPALVFAYYCVCVSCLQDSLHRERSGTRYGGH